MMDARVRAVHAIVSSTVDSHAAAPALLPSTDIVLLSGGSVMDRAGWVTDDVDITVPNAARVYDFALGGFHNFEVDRVFFEQAVQAWPAIRTIAHANRAYLRRVVQWLTDAGIRQFLDVGSGIPTLGNVHEVAQRGAPDARVAYVDIDPVAVSHGQAILADNANACAIRADLRDPQAILGHPEVAGLFDFTRPVAILMIAVLHFVPDDAGPADIIARYRDAVAGGSYLALSHGISDDNPTDGQEQVRNLYKRTPIQIFTRTPAEITAMLAGFELVEPGIVPVDEWHPDADSDDHRQHSVVAAVARKP
jgi:hypothetical protein